MKSAAADSDLVRHPTSRAPIRSLASRDSANAWSWPSTLATCLRFTLQHRRRCVSIAFCSQLLSSFSPRGERSGSDTKVGRRWHNTANKKAGCTQEKKQRKNKHALEWQEVLAHMENSDDARPTISYYFFFLPFVVKRALLGSLCQHDFTCFRCRGACSFLPGLCMKIDIIYNLLRSTLFSSSVFFPEFAFPEQEDTLTLDRPISSTFWDGQCAFWAPSEDQDWVLKNKDRDCQGSRQRF